MTNISTPRSRRSGFTLIEVAIALAIFVFGALAIVQIFPPALGVIRNNEGRVTAMQLGETLLNRTAGKPNSVPDAIYERDYTITDTANPYQWRDVPAAVVGTPSRNNALPAGPLPANFAASALSRFRFIDGERHTVNRDVNDGVKWVMLNYPATAETVWVDQEETINGVQIDEDGKLDFRYATDSQGASFGRTNMAAGMENNPPDNKTSDDGVIYYVSYKWVEGTPLRTHGVIDEPLLIPEGVWTGNDGLVVQGANNSDDRIIPGSIKVRYRQRIGSTILTAQPASTGYYMVHDGTVSQVLDASNNPVDLTAGRTYRFSYMVSDWRWLVDDQNAPTTSGFAQLPVKNLDEQPVWAARTRIGDTIKPDLLTAPVVNYKNGTVQYTGGNGFRYRTVYRALDGWAQQLSVSAKSYIPFYATRPASSPREPWREYYWEGALNNQLFFHPSEAGKSVSVSYMDTTGKVISGAVLMIDNIETPSAFPDGPPGGFFGQYDNAGTITANNKAAYTVITDPTGNPAPNVASILSVQGLSVQARTAWQNAERYNQLIVPEYRTLLQ